VNIRTKALTFDHKKDLTDEAESVAYGKARRLDAIDIEAMPHDTEEQEAEKSAAEKEFFSLHQLHAWQCADLDDHGNRTA
jgi:hypothetical protein